jgi:hypothetical protein
MARRRGAGEVEDAVDLDVQRERDVVAQQLEARVLEQRRDVRARAGVEVVDAQIVAVGDKPRTQVRAEEARTAGHERRIRASS